MASSERRIARRWATSWRAPGSHVEPDQKDDDVTPAVKDKEEVHPVEALLNGLMDPSDDDVAQRAQEYERYVSTPLPLDLRPEYRRARELTIQISALSRGRPERLGRAGRRKRSAAVYPCGAARTG